MKGSWPENRTTRLKEKSSPGCRRKFSLDVRQPQGLSNLFSESHKNELGIRIGQNSANEKKIPICGFVAS